MTRIKPALRRRVFCVSLGLALGGCTSPPSVQREDLPSLIAMLYPEKKITDETAFGNVRVAVDGEVHSGSIETVLKNTGEFRSDVYSPLGGVVASVRADSAKGALVFEGREHAFTLSQTMDSLPFSWGGFFTFGELQRILLGRVPATYLDLLRTPPDTLVRENKTISAVWKTDSGILEAAIRRTSACIDKVTIGASEKRAWRVTLGSFKRGFAHKIELYESDVNYFLIEYSKVRSN